MTTYAIWYMKPEHFSEGAFGTLVANPLELDKTHVLLKNVEARDLEDVFMKMQGEVWSPNGEARQLIRSKGLQHTSMSMGDIAVDPDGVAWMVAMFGFKEVKVETPR